MYFFTIKNYIKNVVFNCKKQSLTRQLPNQPPFCVVDNDHLLD